MGKMVTSTKKWVCPELPKMKYGYSVIKRMIKNNNVPKEWDELYDGIVQMINEDFALNPNKTLFVKELEIPWSIGRDYYLDDNDAAKSPAKLLNEYLSTRLAKEGYHQASMRLIYIPSKGNRWAKEINAMRQREYEIEYEDWRQRKYRYDTQEVNEILGGVASPGKEPTAPKYLESEYQSSRYVIMVQCSKKKNDRTAKSLLKDTMKMQRSATKNKSLGSLLVFASYVLPILALAIVMAAACGICTLLIPDFEIQLILSIATAPLIIVGLLIGWGIHSKLYNDGYIE